MQQLLDSEIIEEDGEKFELVFFMLKLDIKKNYVMWKNVYRFDDRLLH